MKALLLSVLTILLLSSLTSLKGELPQAQLVEIDGKGAIDCVVKTPNSSDGIPDVRVSLVSLSTVQGAAPVKINRSTDAVGLATFSNLPKGTYTITAQRDGYFPLGPDGDSPYAPSAKSVVTVTNERPIVQAVLNLVEGGVISGRIRDSSGNPVIRASVVALHAVYLAGRRTLAPISPFTGTVSAQTTNDRGEYRLFGLQPGEYFIQVDAGHRTATSVSQTTYYPDTIEVSRAFPVVVRPGVEASNVDLRIEYARSFAVSGKISVLISGGLTAPNGELSRAVSSFLVVRQDSDRRDNIPPTTNASFSFSRDQVSFDFRLEGIASGAYFLYPLFVVGDSRRDAGNTRFTTRIPVSVVDRDVEGIQGVIQQYPDLRVMLTLKGIPLSGTAALPPLSIELRPQESLPAQVASTLNRAGLANAETVFPNLLPGKYQVSIPSVPSGFYLADIRQGGLSVNKDAIITASTKETLPIEILLSNGDGQIQGVVRDARGQQASASVVLVPQPPLRSNSTLYKSVAVPLNSGFNLHGITPGEYKIFAWEHLPHGAEENEQFLVKYENRGKVLTVMAGSKISDLVLDVIPDDTR